MKKIGNSNIYKGVGCSNCIIKHKSKTRLVKLNKEEIDEYEKIMELNKTEDYKLQKKKRLIAEGIIGHNKEHLLFITGCAKIKSVGIYAYLKKRYK